MKSPTEQEKEEVEKLSPILERVARRFARKLPYAEAYSAGYSGLVKAVRGHDPEKGDLADWAALCCQNSIQDELRKERRYESRRRHMVSVVDQSTTEDDRFARIDELPPYLRRTVLTWLEQGGNVRKTAAAIDRSEAEVKDNLEISRKYLENMA